MNRASASHAAAQPSTAVAAATRAPQRHSPAAIGGRLLSAVALGPTSGGFCGKVSVVSCATKEMTSRWIRQGCIVFLVRRRTSRCDGSIWRLKRQQTVMERRCKVRGMQWWHR